MTTIGMQYEVKPGKEEEFEQGFLRTLELLRTLAPTAIVDSKAPFVDAGRIVTAGGAATSLDASLHLVRRLRSKEAARWIAEVYLDHDAWNPAFEGRAGSSG